MTFEKQAFAGFTIITLVAAAVVGYVFWSKANDNAWAHAHLKCPKGYELYLTRSGRKFCALQPTLVP